MDYQKIYNNLMKKGQNRVLDTYSETHHIIPSCMGGSNDKSNLVKLTPEEHYLAHQLLVKIFPTNNGLIYAAHMMGNFNTRSKRNNKMYGWLRRKHSQSISKINKGNTYSVGRFPSSETRQKISNSLKGRPSANKGRKHTMESRQAMRNNCARNGLGKFGSLNANAKAVLQFTMNEEFIAEYGSAQDATKITGIGFSGISKTCNGQQQSSKGFIWRFKEA